MDQMAAVQVTDKLMETWAVVADQFAPYILPGEINWVMMVRSLTDEIRRLKSTIPNS